MPLISGVGTAAGLAKEVTYGTAEARTRTVALNGTTLTQAARQRTARGALSKSKGFVASRFVTANEVGGVLTIPATYSSLGLLYEATLGAVSGSGPFTFAAGEVAAVPSLTIEQIVGNSGKSEVYVGCKVTTATLTLTPGGEVTWAFDLIAKSKATADTAGSLSVGTPVPIEAYEVGVTYGGTAVTLQRDLTLTITNSLARRQRLGSLDTAEPTVEGNRECTVVMPVDKQAFANRVTELADGAANLVITLTDTATGAKTIVITVSCQLKSDEQIGTSMGVLADGLTFESVGLPTIVVTNGESTYDV